MRCQKGKIRPPEINCEKSRSPIFRQDFSGLKGQMLSLDKKPGAWDCYRHFERKIEGFNSGGMDCFWAEIIRRLAIKKFKGSLKCFNRNWRSEKDYPPTAFPEIYSMAICRYRR